MGSVWALSVVIPIFESNMLPVPFSLKNVTNHLLMVSMPLRARLEDTVSWTAEVLCFVDHVRSFDPRHVSQVAQERLDTFTAALW